MRRVQEKRADLALSRLEQQRSKLDALAAGLARILAEDDEGNADDRSAHA